MSKSPTTATYDDVNLLVKLYDLRREERLREARTWFAGKFHVKTLEEFNQLCPMGSTDNASFRMVVSYWDMVASFIAAGVLNQDLFFESNRELLLVYVRIGHLLENIRATVKDPFAYHNLEKVAKAYIEWLNQRSPGSFEAFAERIGKLR